MVKKTKYPNGDLSDEEERIIDLFAFLCVGVYYALMEKYRTAKKIWRRGDCKDDEFGHKPCKVLHINIYNKFSSQSFIQTMGNK